MNRIARRIQLCKLIERMNRDREFAKKLGLEDVSEFDVIDLKDSKMKGDFENERYDK